MTSTTKLADSNSQSMGFSEVKENVLKYLATSFVVICLLFSPVYAQKKEKDKLLAAKIYEVTFTEQGKKKPKTTPDVLTFKSEKISSPFILQEYQLTGSPYTATIDSSATPPPITFQSEVKTAKEETITWIGSVAEETIEGTVTVVDKKGKTKGEYTFTGTQKVKKKK